MADKIIEQTSNRMDKYYAAQHVDLFGPEGLIYVSRDEPLPADIQIELPALCNRPIELESQGQMQRDFFQQPEMWAVRIN